MHDREMSQVTAAVHRHDAAVFFRFLLTVALVVAIAIIALDNRNKARIGYAIGEATAPVWVLVVASAVGGMLIGWLIRHRSHHDG